MCSCTSASTGALGPHPARTVESVHNTTIARRSLIEALQVLSCTRCLLEYLAAVLGVLLNVLLQLNALIFPGGSHCHHGLQEETVWAYASSSATSPVDIDAVWWVWDGRQMVQDARAVT
eukprot:1312578-Amphidinium_carterae.1